MSQQNYKLLEELDDYTKQNNALESAMVKRKTELLLKERQAETGPVFPIEVFPSVVQDVIKSYHSCTKYPIDYYGMSALMCGSVFIGNSYAAEYLPHFYTSPLLYGMIVARSGVGKNRIINSMLSYMYRKQETMFDENETELETWKQEKFEKEVSNSKEEVSEEPKAKRMFIGNTTIEQAYRVMKKNRRGVMMLRQEVVGWIKGLNSYRAGSDGETYLEIWDNDVMSVERVGSTLYIRRPNLQPYGGIQPKVLQSLVGEGRENNGFIPRILFAYPADLTKKHPTMNTPDPNLINKYEEIIKRIDELPSYLTGAAAEEYEGEIKSIHLRLDEEARKRFFQFICENTDDQNAAQEEIIREIYAKMDNYCLRFACILFLFDFCARNPDVKYMSCAQMEAQKIPVSFIEDSIKLVHYFKHTAMKVVDRFQSPLNELADNKQAWYESLPDEFTLKVALESWEGIGLKKRSLQMFLNNRTLFERLPAKGHYRKIFF